MKEKVFFKSISGTYYYGEFPVDFPAGYELVTKEEYNDWCKKRGFLDWIVE